MTENKIDDLQAVRIIAETLSSFQRPEQERIIRWVLEKTGLPPGSVALPRVEESSTFPSFSLGSPSRLPSTPVDIKSFVAQKNPRSDNQFAATVAYFYRFEAPEAERKSNITSQDLVEACRLAGWKRMADPPKTLANAQGVGLLNKVERGQFTISSVGENLVALTLPEGSGRTIEAKTGKRKPKKLKRSR
jgi:hypothetical protein